MVAWKLRLVLQALRVCWVLSNIQLVLDKILSLALDEKNRKIVAASDAKGKVYIFSLESGSTLSTYLVGDEYAITPTIVWSLLFVG